MADRLHTVDEIASRLRTSSETIRRYLRAGKLNGIRLSGSWRISERALNAFLQERSTRSFQPQFETKGHE